MAFSRSRDKNQLAPYLTPHGVYGHVTQADDQRLNFPQSKSCGTGSRRELAMSGIGTDVNLLNEDVLNSHQMVTLWAHRVMATTCSD
jgi:hypothetical protein